MTHMCIKKLKEARGGRELEGKKEGRRESHTISVAEDGPHIEILLLM